MKDESFEKIKEKYCGKDRYSSCYLKEDHLPSKEEKEDFRLLKRLLLRHLSDIHEIRDKVGLKEFSVPKSVLIRSVYFGGSRRKTITVEYIELDGRGWLGCWCPKISDLLNLDDFKVRYLEKCIDERRAELEKKIDAEMTKLGELLEAQKKLEEL